MSKSFEIKISGSGTADQIGVRLIELGRQFQVANVYKEEDKLAGTQEDGCLIAEITEE